MYNTTWPHLFWKIFVDFLTSTLLRAQNTTLLSKVRRRFFQILWPSQKTQTLNAYMVWCPTWSKNLGRYLVIGCIKICRVADTEMTCDMQVFSCTLSKVKVAKFKKVFSFLSHLQKKVQNYCPSSFLVWLKGWWTVI